MTSSRTSRIGRTAAGVRIGRDDAVERLVLVAVAMQPTHKLARKGRSTVGAMLQPLGLYPGQEVLLLYLGDQGVLSQAELTNALGLDHSTVAKMVRRMQAARLIERRTSASDRRIVLVSLTGEGEAACQAVKETWAEMEKIVTVRLSDRDRAHLLRLLIATETTFDQHS